jgi:hypothetical protein
MVGRKKRQKAPAKQMAARTQRSLLNDAQQPVVCLDEKVRPFSAASRDAKRVGITNTSAAVKFDRKAARQRFRNPSEEVWKLFTPACMPLPLKCYPVSRL